MAGERVSGGFGRREDAIHSIRKRLCLPADRDDEIADALGDRLRKFDGLWDVGPVERTVVTLWWDPARVVTSRIGRAAQTDTAQSTNPVDQK